jgi:hypothetical protein
MAGWGKQLVVTFVRAQIIQRLLNMSFYGVLLSRSAKLDANDRPAGKADRTTAGDRESDREAALLHYSPPPRQTLVYSCSRSLKKSSPFTTYSSRVGQVTIADLNDLVVCVGNIRINQ